MAVYFSIFLVIVTGITGVVWLFDKISLAPKRKQALAEAQSQCKTELDPEVVEKILEPSPLIDTAVQTFPVIAFVLILRSFLWEPFQIPSGSMMPTLLDGDFILVNKFNYGVKDPVTRSKFIEVGLPERGDVVVFKYPINPEIDYIKRVIGLPGDRIIYRNKSIYIKPPCLEKDKECPKYEQVVKKYKADSESPDGSYGLSRYTSFMPNKTHDTLIDNEIIPRTPFYCSQAEGRLCTQPGTEQDEFIVPKGHYFVMGDNRDHSADSRYWGFVPEENLVGEAVAIWMSFNFDRPADSFLPHWIPTGIRFERIGAIN